MTCMLSAYCGLATDSYMDNGVAVLFSNGLWLYAMCAVSMVYKILHTGVASL